MKRDQYRETRLVAFRLRHATYQALVRRAQADGVGRNGLSAWLRRLVCKAADLPAADADLSRGRPEATHEED